MDKLYAAVEPRHLSTALATQPAHSSAYLRSEPEQPVQDASEQPLQRTTVVEAPEQPVEARVTCGDVRFLHYSTHPFSDEADGLPLCPTCTREHVVVSHA